MHRAPLIKINGATVKDAEKMANEFNNYFTNIAQSFAEKIPTTAIPFNSYLQNPSLTSMGLLSTSLEEILEIGRDIRLTHSKGTDDIDPCLAAPSLRMVAKPLAEVINCSPNSGVVPHAIKTAKVVPIFKKGEKDSVTNYCPISILPYFSV